MKMMNRTSTPVFVEELNLRVPPGETVDVDDGYCLPRKGAGANADYQMPIIAMLAPQLEPADKELVSAYRANKLTEGLIAPQPPQKTVADLQAAGMAPAVAELVAAGNAAPVPKIASASGTSAGKAK